MCSWSGDTSAFSSTVLLVLVKALSSCAQFLHESEADLGRSRAEHNDWMKTKINLELAPDHRVDNNQ